MIPLGRVFDDQFARRDNPSMNLNKLLIRIGYMFNAPGKITPGVLARSPRAGMDVIAWV
jgi:hypothetical protein